MKQEWMEEELQKVLFPFLGFDYERRPHDLWRVYHWKRLVFRCRILRDQKGKRKGWMITENPTLPESDDDGPCTVDMGSIHRYQENFATFLRGRIQEFVENLPKI